MNVLIWGVAEDGRSGTAISNLIVVQIINCKTHHLIGQLSHSFVAQMESALDTASIMANKRLHWKEDHRMNITEDQSREHVGDLRLLVH